MTSSLTTGTTTVRLSTGAEARLGGAASLAAVLVNGGTGSPVRGTWSATSELLARIQATDQRFDGADGSSPNGALGAAEIGAIFGGGGNQPSILLQQLLGTYFDLATRRINAGTKIASRTDTRLGLANVEVRAGDGYLGWPEAAPFDAIVVTAAAPRVPEPLKQQLKVGGRIILPVGDEWQELVVVTRRDDRFEERQVLPVRFVPMTGKVRQ